MRLLVRCIQLLLALLLAFGMWAGWYVSNRGFTKKWRGLVSREFQQRGVDISVRRITLDPFQGIVARDVQIMDAKDPEKVLALVDRAVLDIDYAHLIRNEPFLNAVDLRNADIWLPLEPDDPNSERVEISRLNARLLMPPHEFYLSEAEATIYGVQISARGRLANPESFHPSASKSSSAGGQQIIKNIIAELRKMRFPGGAPRIELNFTGDLADPRSIFVEGTFWGQQMQRGDYQIANAYAVADFRGGVLDLKRCAICDARGALDASGSYDTDARHAALHVRSTLDLQALAHVIPGAPRILDEWIFYTPPTIEFSAEAMLADQPAIKVLGHLALQKFGVKSVIFDGASADFSWDGGRWYVRDATLQNRTGGVRVDAMALPRDFRATIQSTINPNTLRPFFSGKSAEALADWDFQQSPKLNLTISGAAPDFDQCEAHGEVELGRTRMRGVPFNSASAKVQIKNGSLTYENFKITRNEGAATGTFTYDFGKHEARLNNVKTQVNPTEAAMWIDPDLAHNVAPYRCKTAPFLSINGLVDCAHETKGKGTKLEVLVDAPGGMEYVFCKKTLVFPKVSGRLFFVNRRMRIENAVASFYGGRLLGGADISLARELPGYTARIEAQAVNFESVTKLYFDYENSRGLLNGVFDFRGKSDDARTIQGHGAVSVDNGNVFAIPVLGPFSGILNSIVPGMGFNVAHKAGCTFEMNNGVLSTRDFLVKGQGFSMIGEGKLFFLDDKIDFNIRLNAQGLPGVLLFPVSKLFEYASDGSLSKPVWKPKRLPAL
jgi:hypothetical protein